MIVLGLTGSIGMGKSATAQMFRDEGISVYDADAAVHALYAPGGAAAAALEGVFPGVVRHGAVDRTALSAQVLQDPAAMRRLEEIVHPLARQAQQAFLRTRLQAGDEIVVLDIPLLFETGGDQYMDAVVVVTAPEAVQRERVLARPGMTDEKFRQILARQTPDAEKRARADFLINTGLGFEEARRQVRLVLDAIRAEETV